MSVVQTAAAPHAVDRQPSAFEVRCARLNLRLFPQARYRIYEMLGRLLGADIDARSALEFIYAVVSNDGRSKGDLQAIAVGQWLTSFREHGRISEALTGWVPQIDILLLEAGERSGRFQAALEVMHRLNARRSEIRGMIVGKLAYPVLTTAILFAVLYFMATSLLPRITAMRSGFTGSAGFLVEMMAAIRVGLLPGIVLLGAATALTLFTMPVFRGRARTVLDRVPPWSVHRFISGTSFLSALLVLMESGRGLVDALTLIQLNASPYLREKIVRIEQAMREGAGFGEALTSTGDDFPDRELIKEIQIFARIGRLDDGLLAVVEQWMRKATDRTGAQIAVLGNLLMAGSFALLGLTFTGLYDIIGQLQQG